jgi:hypothetical protein
LVLTLVLTDGGAQANHLIDAVVLIPIVAAELFGLVAKIPAASTARLAFVMVVLWAVGLSYGRYVQHDVRDAAASIVGVTTSSVYDAQPLRGHVSPGDSVLAQDPYVDISIGQQPVVMDPWMLAILGKQHPAWLASLARRVEAQQFKAVVLSQRLETSDDVYRRTVFGELVLTAVCRQYHFSAMVNGYWIYVPAAGAPALAAADTQGPNACATRSSAVGPRPTVQGDSTDGGG